jgi:hypothetical protein
VVTGGFGPEFWEGLKYRLRFSLRSTLGVWGPSGIAAVVLACCIVVFGVFWILPAVRRLEVIEVRSAERSSIPILRSAFTPITATNELFGFYKSFPPGTLILTITDQINQVAEHSGIHITQADYRVNDDLSGLVRYEVSLTARGAYPQLRSFTAACLTGFPTLSLDGLTLSRSSVTDTAIDAQFRFSIYMSANSP